MTGQASGEGPRPVRAAVLVAPSRLELREFERPAVTDDTATVAIELCGICGTDLKYFSGALIAPYPMILGHEIVGRVAEIGPAAAERHGISAGERVLVESSIPCWACDQCRSGAYRLCPTKGGYGTRLSTTHPPGLWGGLAELLFLAPGSIVHRLPESLPAAAALGVPLLANGLQWLVRKGDLGPGGRVLIQGCGPQGLAAAIVARSAGAAEIVVTGLPRDAARLDFAARAGSRPVVVEPDLDRAELVRRLGDGFDIALDVTGSPASIASAPAHLRPLGTLVLAGLVGRDVTVPLRTDELVWREIRVQAVLSKDAAAISAALAMTVGDERIASELAALTTHVFPLEAAAEAVAAVDAGQPGFVKAAVRPTR